MSYTCVWSCAKQREGKPDRSGTGVGDRAGEGTTSETDHLLPTKVAHRGLREKKSRGNTFRVFGGGRFPNVPIKSPDLFW